MNKLNIHNTKTNATNHIGNNNLKETPHFNYYNLHNHLESEK